LFVIEEDEMINEYNVVVYKPKGKGPLGRPRRRQEDNIRMGPRETGWEGADWIHLVQNKDQRRAVVNTVMNLRLS
jgi:hypothetical protein